MFRKKRRKLAIYGAGGHAVAVAELARDCGWEVVCHLYDRGEPRSGLVRPTPCSFDLNPRVMERIGVVTVNTHDVDDVVIAVGAPYDRWKIWRKLQPFSWMRFPSLVHPTAVCAGRLPQGAVSGVIVMPMAVIRASSEIWNFSLVNTGAVIEHGVAVREGASIGPNATMCGDARIGERVEIGAGAVVLPKVQIGAGARIGAGAVVTRDVPPGETWVGNPARRLERSAS